MTTEQIRRLPAGFEDLAPFAGWALATETERNHRRIDAPMAEIEAFCAAMMGRLDAIMTHFGETAPEDLEGPDLALYDMVLSLAEIAPAIESYRQPTVVDGFASRRFVAEEDFVLRPAR